MKAALFLILLASIYLLHARADIPHVPIDFKKFAGTWYPRAYVLKNRDPLNIIPLDDRVEPSGGGDAVLTKRYIKDGKCQVTEVKVVHTDQPGVFKFAGTSEVIHVVDADYKSYYIVHIVENNTYRLYLSSRTREPSEDVKTKFREFAETLGFDVNQIVYAHLAGKSEFGGMFEECTASIIGIKVFQVNLTAICHIF
ncbi:UNVERIFIED_CONTAM: hypothetical protein K2H54_040560 [Gekko kuhli]